MNKLLRYLQWSGLERKHFLASGQEIKCTTIPDPSGRNNASSHLPSRVLAEENNRFGELGNSIGVRMKVIGPIQPIEK